MRVNHSERANTVVIQKKRGSLCTACALKGTFVPQRQQSHPIISHFFFYFFFWSCSEVLIGAPEKLCHAIMCSGEVILSG